MHLDSKDIKQFEKNKMKTDEAIAFLEHLDACDFCLEKLISDETLTENIHTPACLKEQILSRAAQADVQTAKAIKETSQKMQLFYYSLRTAAGVIAALVLLFTLNNVDFSSLNIRKPVAVETIVPKQLEGSRRNYLNEFSANLGRQLNKGTSALSAGLNHFTNFINGGA